MKKVIQYPTIGDEFYFQWHLTERCNLKCLHCYKNNETLSEIPLKDLLVIVDKMEEDLAKWGKRGTLSLTGGELVSLHLVEAHVQTDISIRHDKAGGLTFAYAAPPPERVAFTGPGDPVVDKMGWSEETVWIDTVKPKKGVLMPRSPARSASAA